MLNMQFLLLIESSDIVTWWLSYVAECSVEFCKTWFFQFYEFRIAQFTVTPYHHKESLNVIIRRCTNLQPITMSAWVYQNWTIWSDIAWKSLTQEYSQTNLTAIVRQSERALLIRVLMSFCHWTLTA